MKYILPALLLGFVAYGLSIFTYIRAQKTLGAAKTSAYYAVAPFIGAFLSFVLLHEKLTAAYIIALSSFICNHRGKPFQRLLTTSDCSSQMPDRS